MALSTKARKRLEVAMARRAEAKEIADEIDLLSASTAGGTLTSAQLLVGNGSNVATDVALSGDATLDNTGALTIAALAVTGAKMANATITATQLASAAVTFVKAKAFISTVQTGTGSAQNVAHGLGVAPTAVLIVPVVTAGALGIAYGTHTSTNVVTTVTIDDTFIVLAWV